MTCDRFCAKHFMPFPEQRAFKLWLDDNKDAVLTEYKWLELWDEFAQYIPNRVN